jgi:FKBP-type peptidyl-prolyl cis-trans isomerase
VKNTATAALAAVLLLAACTPSAPPKATPKTDEEKTVYAFGVAGYESMKMLTFTPAELELVIAGLRDASAGKPVVTLDEKRADLQKFALARQSAFMEKQKTESSASGSAYLEKAAKETGAEKTASGLIYIKITEGTGKSPVAADQVKVNYTGKLVDGTVFDASSKHGGPATFPLGGVIPCWTEGVAKMKVGGKARLVCPASIAYGDRGAGGAIPPGAVLDFEVELLEIVK